jgi:hypothetical protein
MVLSNSRTLNHVISKEIILLKNKRFVIITSKSNVPTNNVDFYFTKNHKHSVVVTPLVLL